MFDSAEGCFVVAVGAMAGIAIVAALLVFL